MNYDASFVFRFFFSFAAEKKNRFEVKTDWKRKKNSKCIFFGCQNDLWEENIFVYDSTASIYSALYSNRRSQERRNLDQGPHSNDERFYQNSSSPFTLHTLLVRAVQP